MIPEEPETSNESHKLKQPPVTEWPPDFFEQTYGSLADDPIERPDQGELEERDSFDS